VSAYAVLADGGTTTAQSGAGCRAMVDAQKRDWALADAPRRQPPDIDGAVVTHWPTRDLGTWVVERRHEAGTTLTRVTPADMTEAAWSPACVPTVTRRRRAVAAGPRFSDDDLADRLRSARAGVIYLWSPHMPLSVDGVAHTRLAAGAQGLLVDVVLEPGADRAFAAAVAASHGWSDDTLRVADSVELTFRDVLVHAPTVQVYAGGRFVGSAYPGFHTAAEYEPFFDRALRR
jgi:hypothetical protein